MSSLEGRISSNANELLLRLWPDALSVSDARHAVGDFCRDGGLGDLAADAELLTSELMTNACGHASGLITLTALRDPRAVAVTVSDDNASGEQPQVQPTDLERDSGRGLALVEAIAGEWGATHGDARTTVWFRLP